MFECKKTALLCAICRGGLGACVRRHATGAHRRGSERRTLPPGLENSGLLITRPRVLLRARFFPHAETYPAPIGAGQHGELTAGRGTPSTRKGKFFRGENRGLPRIMRAPVRPGCGHISRAKRTDVIYAWGLTAPPYFPGGGHLGRPVCGGRNSAPHEGRGVS